MVVSASMSAVTKKIGVRVRDHDFLDVRVRVRVRGHGCPCPPISATDIITCQNDAIYTVLKRV